MSPNSTLTLFQVGIAVFSILAIVCGYGAYYFKNKIENERDIENRNYQTSNFEKAEDDRQTKHDELNKIINEAVLELKNFTVRGSPSLVDKIPENADWDLLEGSVYLLVGIPEETDKILVLRIESKTKNAHLEIIISSTNVRFVYFNPELGQLSKTAKLLQSDFKNEQRNVVLSFIWNLKKQKTNIYINQDERA